MGSIKPVPWRGRVPGYQAPGIVVSPALARDSDSRKYLLSRGTALVGRLSELKDLLSHLSSVKPDANGNLVLVPGTNNAHGIGVYFAELGKTGRSESSANYEIVVSKRQAEQAGVVFDDNCWPKALTGIRLHAVEREVVGGRTRFYCVVTEVLDDIETGIVRTSVFSDGTKATARSIRKQREMATPSQCLGPRYWLIGKLLALTCFIKALTLVRTNSWSKWAALGWFLSGIDGTWTIPSSIAKDWNTGVVKQLDDGNMFIRPSANTALFWIVGGMTLQNRGDGVYVGVDVYDFHPQKGQRTIAGDKCFTWAWSGGHNDPTQIPSNLKWVNLYNMLRWVAPKLRYRYIRERDGRLLMSNDLWNAIGGKPFRSVVKVTENQDSVTKVSLFTKVKSLVKR